MSNLYKRFLYGLLVLIAVVSAGHVIVQLSLHQGAPSSAAMVDFVNRLSLDTEMSLPTWLACFLGIVAGSLALLIRRASRAKLAWYLLATGMFLISIDEVAALHELLLQGIHIEAGLGTTQTLTSNAWLFVLPFVATAFIAALIYWSINLPRRTFIRLFTGFGIYALGAVVVEYASIQVDKGTRVYTIGYTPIEEILEYLGLWLIIRASLLHIKENLPVLEKDIGKLLGK